MRGGCEGSWKSESRITRPTLVMLPVRNPWLVAASRPKARRRALMIVVCRWSLARTKRFDADGSLDRRQPRAAHGKRLEFSTSSDDDRRTPSARQAYGAATPPAHASPPPRPPLPSNALFIADLSPSPETLSSAARGSTSRKRTSSCTSDRHRFCRAWRVAPASAGEAMMRPAEERPSHLLASRISRSSAVRRVPSGDSLRGRRRRRTRPPSGPPPGPSFPPANRRWPADADDAPPTSTVCPWSTQADATLPSGARRRPVLAHVGLVQDVRVPSPALCPSFLDDFSGRLHFAAGEGVPAGFAQHQVARPASIALGPGGGRCYCCRAQRLCTSDRVKE